MVGIIWNFEPLTLLWSLLPLLGQMYLLRYLKSNSFKSINSQVFPLVIIWNKVFMFLRLLPNISKIPPTFEKTFNTVVNFHLGLYFMMRGVLILLVTWRLCTFTSMKPKILKYFLGVHRTNSTSNSTSWNHSTTTSCHFALVDIFVGKAGELRYTLV